MHVLPVGRRHPDLICLSRVHEPTAIAARSARGSILLADAARL
jgi:hypothetical protein